MSILRKKASVLFLSSFMFLTPIDDSTTLEKDFNNVEQVQVTEANLLESLSTIPLSRSKVKLSGNKITFNIGTKKITLIDDSKLALVKDNDKITEYYFLEKFDISNGYVNFSKPQYNLLVNGVESKYASRIRYGQAIDRVDNRNFINIYSDEGLNNPLIKVDVDSDVKIINTVFDGKFKVLTSNGDEGFVDTRFLRILDDTLPPSEKDLIVDTDYVLTLDQDSQRMKIYKKDMDSYELLKDFAISTGMSSEHTPNGIFEITENRGPWFFTPRYNSGAKYYVQFKGNYLLHSIPFHEDQTIDYEAANKLGSKVSTGCVRLELESAKWIYDNIPKGSLVIINNKDTNIYEVIRNKNI